jgi:prepilin-type N-terminal cleavage/methylation domain-containing protein
MAGVRRPARAPHAGQTEDFVSIAQRARQRGYSIVELMIAMAVTTVLMAVIFSMMEEAVTLSLFVESHNDLTTMSQRALNSVQTEILQSRQVFLEDAIGTGYRTKIEALLTDCGLTAPCPSSLWKLKPVAGTQLPGNDPALTLAPDPVGSRYTGNALLVARQLPPVAINVVAGSPVASYPALTFYVDRYRFEYFYLTFHGTPNHSAFRNGDHILDMWQVRTIEYADYSQLANATVNMSAGQLTDLSTKLQATVALPAGTIVSGPNPPNLQTAWSPGQPIASAFYNIDANLTLAAPIAAFSFAAADLASGGSLLPALSGGRIGGKMDYTVAYLNSVAAGPPGGRLLAGVPLNEAGTDGRNPLPQYAQLAPSLPLDCGLEVKVVGQAGARQVLARLVMYSNYRVTRVDSTEAFVISSFTR